MAEAARLEFFRAAVDDAHGTPRAPRQERRDRIGRVHLHTAAEAGAHRRLDDADFRFRQPEHVGQVSAKLERHLVDAHRVTAPDTGS
jgi:hypothetical protein